MAEIWGMQILLADQAKRRPSANAYTVLITAENPGPYPLRICHAQETGGNPARVRVAHVPAGFELPAGTNQPDNNHFVMYNHQLAETEAYDLISLSLAAGDMIVIWTDREGVCFTPAPIGFI